jgi:hypothetical protein
MKSNLKPAAGAKHAKRRVGRGIGSGLGKTWQVVDIKDRSHVQAVFIK